MPRRPEKTEILLVFISILLSALPFYASAQELSYDRYAPMMREDPAGARRAAPLRSSRAKNIATHFLVYPFEIIRWPIDKGLVLTEKYYLDKKVQWVYDTVEDQGIVPRGHIVRLGSLGGGADVDFIRLIRQKENFPDATLRAWADWSKDTNFDFGSEMGLERIANTNFHVSEMFRYQNLLEEHFYGIGPNTSAGDGTSYRREGTTLETKAGYRWSPTTGADLNFAYRNINITNGEDGGRGIIDRIFPTGSIPGLDGDEILSFGGEAVHDTRNLKASSTRGGRRRFGFSYHEGLYGSRARYFKYEAEANQYQSLGSPRRVLAFHFYGEHNDEINNGTVPFYQMAKLGGFGAYPRMSHTLRGSDFNRFFDESAVLFNLEYRYTIWEYRDFKLDSVLFWDEGQAFGEFSRFQLKDFRESYGLGFRVSAVDHVFFSIEIAHGDEGTRFYVKSSTPF